MKLKLETLGQSQITIDGLAQLTVTEGGLTIDLAGPSLSVVQEGGRLEVRLNPRLAYVAPEIRGEVAGELGLEPYEYVRKGCA